MIDAFATSLFVRAVGWALMHSLWQGAVIGLLTGSALVGLRRSTPDIRYVVACAGLAALLLLPVTTATRYARSWGDAQVQLSAIAPPFSPTAGRTVGAPADLTLEQTSPADIAPLRWAERLDWWTVPAVLLWLTGVFVLSMRLVIGWLVVERLRRAARPVSDEWCARVERVASRIRVARPIRVIETAVVASPMVIGWLRPVIVLPVAALTGLTPLQLEAVLAHEIAHIRRHDYLANLLQTIAETLLFYHPASWWISRRIREEREHCCDDVAVALCGDRLTYASALADLEQMRRSHPPLALAASDGPLLRRVRRLMGVTVTDTGRSPVWGIAIAVIVLFALVVMHEDVTSAQAGRDGATVRGRVVDAVSGVPVGGSTVELSRGGAVTTISTDVDGRYEAPGLTPGEYKIFVSAAGYVPGQYGQRQPAEDAVSVAVRARQVLSDIDVRLYPMGIVSGRIVDDSGKGLEGVEIELLMRRRGPIGGTAGAVAFGQTDSSGVFRVGELDAGVYFVRAYTRGLKRPARSEPGHVLAPTFFPGVTRMADAEPIVVGAGQERVDIDFALAAARTLVVAGTLSDPSGPRLDQARVMIMRGGGSSPMQTASVSSSGRFEIHDVLPGDYMLTVEDRADPNRWTAAFSHINIDADVSDLRIAARRGARLEGRIVRDGDDPLPFDPRTIEIVFEQRTPGFPGAGDLLNMSGRKIVERDGTFSTVSPGGASLLKVGSLPSGWTVKAIRLDSGDITDQPTDFGENSRRAVEIVLTNRISDVVGVAVDSNGRIVANHTVVVFPEDTSRWKVPSRFVRATRPRQDGWFHIEDLPPANYLAVAVESLPRNAWTDPRVLDLLWPIATRFRLTEGDRRSLQLKVASLPPGLLE
jgi:beta-lactamase regulating signal transducer with metallopeptidase domain